MICAEEVRRKQGRVVIHCMTGTRRCDLSLFGAWKKIAASLKSEHLEIRQTDMSFTAQACEDL